MATMTKADREFFGRTFGAFIRAIDENNVFASEGMPYSEEMGNVAQHLANMTGRDCPTLRRED